MEFTLFSAPSRRPAAEDAADKTAVDGTSASMHGDASALPQSLAPNSPKQRGPSALAVASTSLLSSKDGDRSNSWLALQEGVETAWSHAELLSQLDLLCRDGLPLAGRFMLHRGPRRTFFGDTFDSARPGLNTIADVRGGGQGLVAFASLAPSLSDDNAELMGSADWPDELALKFHFACSAYNREKELGRDPRLYDCLPTILYASTDDASLDAQTAPNGKIWPPFFVLPKGVPLDEYIAKRMSGPAASAGVNPITCIQILMQVAERLEDMHSAGLVHCDVKPANAIRNPLHDEWQVIDLGHAHWAGSHVPLVLTPEFAAPELVALWQKIEQAQQEGVALEFEETFMLVDPALDVWALGLIGYHLLADPELDPVMALGRRMMWVLLHGPVPPPWEQDPEYYRTEASFRALGEPFVYWILKMLSREADQRPSMRECVDAWRKLLQMRPRIRPRRRELHAQLSDARDPGDADEVPAAPSRIGRQLMAFDSSSSARSENEVAALNDSAGHVNVCRVAADLLHFPAASSNVRPRRRSFVSDSHGVAEASVPEWTSGSASLATHATMPPSEVARGTEYRATHAAEAATSRDSSDPGGAAVQGLPILQAGDIQLTSIVISHGRGHDVVRGTLYHVQVAVTVLHSDRGRSPLKSILAGEASENQAVRQGLFKELKLLRSVYHPHVQLFRGVCTSPPMIVSELCEFSSVASLIHLHSNIRSSPSDVSVLFAETKAKRQAVAALMTWPARVQIALEAAQGMQYLHYRGLLHGSLSSNNLLVASSLKVKVSDFALYRKLSDNPLPEDADRSWSQDVQQSRTQDVRAFALVMWELATIQELSDEQRAPGAAPPSLPDDLKQLPGTDQALMDRGVMAFVELMKEAWTEDAAQRPNFDSMVNALKDIRNSMNSPLSLLEERALHPARGPKPPQPSSPAPKPNLSITQRLQQSLQAAMSTGFISSALNMMESGSVATDRPSIPVRSASPSSVAHSSAASVQAKPASLDPSQPFPALSPAFPDSASHQSLASSGPSPLPPRSKERIRPIVAPAVPPPDHPRIGSVMCPDRFARLRPWMSSVDTVGTSHVSLVHSAAHSTPSSRISGSMTSNFAPGSEVPPGGTDHGPNWAGPSRTSKTSLETPQRRLSSERRSGDRRSFERPDASSAQTSFDSDQLPEFAALSLHSPKRLGPPAPPGARRPRFRLPAQHPSMFESGFVASTVNEVAEESNESPQEGPSASRKASLSASVVGEPTLITEDSAPSEICSDTSSAREVSYTSSVLADLSQRVFGAANGLTGELSRQVWSVKAEPVAVSEDGYSRNRVVYNVSTAANEARSNTSSAQDNVLSFAG